MTPLMPPPLGVEHLGTWPSALNVGVRHTVLWSRSLWALDPGRGLVVAEWGPDGLTEIVTGQCRGLRILAAVRRGAEALVVHAGGALAFDEGEASRPATTWEVPFGRPGWLSAERLSDGGWVVLLAQALEPARVVVLRPDGGVGPPLELGSAPCEASTAFDGESVWLGGGATPGGDRGAGRVLHRLSADGTTERVPVVSWAQYPDSWTIHSFAAIGPGRLLAWWHRESSEGRGFGFTGALLSMELVVLFGRLVQRHAASELPVPPGSERHALHLVPERRAVWRRPTEIVVLGADGALYRYGLEDRAWRAEPAQIGATHASQLVGTSDEEALAVDHTRGAVFRVTAR